MNDLPFIQYIIEKYDENRNRMIRVIGQLNDEQINWRPNENCNSIVNIVTHINGNLKERFRIGIGHEPVVRDRDQEFEDMFITKAECIKSINDSIDDCIETIKNMPQEQMSETQIVGKRERTHLDVIFQSATHSSEHLGQIIYIAKTVLDEQYETTTIPKRRMEK